MYVAFDLLHDGSTAINDQPLHQRLKRLEELVKPTGPGERARKLCPAAQSMYQ